MANKKIGIYIGRFQPFHNGHANILKTALEENDFVIVLVGSSHQAATPKNPFDFAARQSMIEYAADDILNDDATFKMVVLPLVDYPYNNSKWIQSVQEAVRRTVAGWGTDSDFTLYGSQRDSSTWYLDAFPQWKKRMLAPLPLDLSATSLRTVLFEKSSKDALSILSPSVPGSTLDFLEHFTLNAPAYHTLRAEYSHLAKYRERWSVAPFPPMFITTDAVVVQSGHILVIERNNFPGRGLWALPGGFLKENLTLLDNTLLELFEETDIRLVDGKRSREITEDILRNALKREKQFDAPDRSLRGRTVTTAFLFELDDTKPLGKVRGMNVPDYEAGGQTIAETNWAKWIPISEARANPQKWFEDHHSIIDYFLG